MNRFRKILSPPGRTYNPVSEATLSFESLPRPQDSAISPPSRARLQKRDKTPPLVHISSSPDSTPSSTPLPSPALIAHQDTTNPFEDPIDIVEAPISDGPTSFGCITIESAVTTRARVEQSRIFSRSYAPSERSVSIQSVEHLPLDPTSSRKSQPKGLRRVLVACRDRIYKHVDPKTIWSIIDIREIFFPITLKRYAVLLVVALLIAAIVITEIFFHWIQQSMAITRRNMLPVLILVIGLEPLMIIIILLVAKIPDISAEDAAPATVQSTSDLAISMSAVEKHATEQDHSTALVIPCHNSDHDAMKRVLESAYPHFRPQDIFIVDNGRSLHPPSPEFREFIRSQSPDINYIWSPIGSKNAAQLVGSLAARNHSYIMTVDDDVCIPANFRPPLDLVDERTKGVAFPLKATDASGKVPLFMVAWQDCEYRMAGLTKLAESQICGVLFPHGAGWFCERETLIDLISNYHSIDFIAEDVNTGLSMQKMKKLIAFDARCILETEVPTTILGSGLNWYNQRVRSWEMGRHGRLLAFAGRLLFSLNGQRTPWGIFAQKFIHVYSIACIIIDWVRIPVLVTMGTNGTYWRQAGLLTLASILPLMWFRFISCRRRPDLRPTFWGSLTIPFYKQLYAFVSIIGAIRSVLFYIGGHQKPKTIRQMIKDGDERCLWLDPRFETNPAFLADDGEKQSAANTASSQTVIESASAFEQSPVATPGLEDGILQVWAPSGYQGVPLYSTYAPSSPSLDYMGTPAQPRVF